MRVLLRIDEAFAQLATNASFAADARGRGEDLRASDPGACWLAAHSKTAAVLYLIMLQAIQTNISTPRAARLSWGACAPPNATARPSNTPGNTCIGAHTSADRILAT
jgi:hypothetical protein